MGIPWQSSELGLSTLTVVAMVQSLVGELRSCKPCSMAKKKRGGEHRDSLTQSKLHRDHVLNEGKQVRIKKERQFSYTIIALCVLHRKMSEG